MEGVQTLYSEVFVTNEFQQCDTQSPKIQPTQTNDLMLTTREKYPTDFL